MSNNNQKEARIEQFMLDDGRRAERHIFFDANGHEVEEVFAEAKRPLQLEERKIRESKTIVARETREKVRDGQVIEREVASLTPDVPMQVRERIAVMPKLYEEEKDYVRKDEIGDIVREGVAAGVAAMMAEMGVNAKAMEAKPAPIFKAQAQLEEKVATEKKSDMTIIWIGVAAIIVQALYFGSQIFVQ